jgi:seryl-tRNA synthetase
MIDFKLLREDPERFRRGARAKGFDVDIDAVLAADEQRRALQASVDARKKELAEKSRLIKKAASKARGGAAGRSSGKSPGTTPGTPAGAAPGASPAELESLQAELREFSRAIKEDEQRLRRAEAEWRELLLQVPNPPLEDVPVGRDESENVELRRVGRIPELGFTPRDHVDLGALHDIFDIERGAKVAGSRCYFLKREGALLENALMRFALDYLVEKGFVPFVTPVFVREESMVGTGYFPVGREEAYAIERDELYLIGTSEVTLVSYHRDEILREDQLPLRYAGHTTCFRREAGSYGKDVRGLYRVHQFQKVEQVVICRDDFDEMMGYHRALLANAEELVQRLGLAYRVVEVCTGEMGMGQIKKHDLECWMPGRGGWGETHSCSSFGDFQARRSGIRFKSAGGGNRYCYTLNNTAVASPRLLIAVVEHYQQPDGSIRIPDALVPYMNGRTVIGG